MMSEFTHIDEKGQARMVDVSEKEVSFREARAYGRVTMLPETLSMIVNGGHKKGDVLATARIAGIMAAKRTSDLIPMCHPLMLSSVKVELTPNEAECCVEISAICKLSGQTGVEMEALTAVSTAALTVYDMAKAVDKEMEIGGIRVLLKDGGKSGRFEAK